MGAFRASLFTGRPWAYPGVPLGEPVMLGLASLQGRRPVVAFGSNTDPAVVRTKLVRGGVTTELPMTPAVLPDVEIAASAHVSVRGYIPAAVLRRAGARLPVVVAWPDPAQLACLDATEPNYRPVVVRDVALPDGRRLDSALLYEARRGVIELPGPLSQVDVWRHALAYVPGLVEACGVGADASESALRELMLAAAGAERLRRRITRLLQTVAAPAGPPPR